MPEETKPEAPPKNRAERRMRAKGKKKPPAPEVARSRDPDSWGATRKQRRFANDSRGR